VVVRVGETVTDSRSVTETVRAEAIDTSREYEQESGRKVGSGEEAKREGRGARRGGRGLRDRCWVRSHLADGGEQSCS
jgi:hypothetical protein